MRQSVRTLLKALVSVMLGLFSLPTLVYGGYLVFCWLRIHTSNVYYADYSYASTGLGLVLLGILSLWAVIHGVWRRSFYGLLFVFPVFVGLAAMVYIPELAPRGNSGMADSNYLSSVNAFVRVWYESHHRFPETESEFKEALAQGPAAWQGRVESAPQSKYRRRSDTVPYQIVVVSNAHGPRLTDVSGRPGMIYYCVSTDLQEFWVTMTSLQSDLAEVASILRVANLPREEVCVIHAAGSDYGQGDP